MQFKTEDGRYFLNVPDEWPWPVVVRQVIDAWKREVEQQRLQRDFWPEWISGDQ